MKNGVQKDWRLTYLEIENWRNFAHVSVPLASRVFLVGPNASGKSNFLDVFRFVRDIASSSLGRGGGFQNALDKRGGVTKVRSLVARGNPSITIRLKVGNDSKPDLWDYTLCFEQKSRLQSPIIKKEIVCHEGQTLKSRPEVSDIEDPRRLDVTALEQLSENKKFRELADFFASVDYLHIVPQLVRDPQRSQGFRRDPYGGDFLDQVALANKNAQSSRLTKIERALRTILPQMKNLEYYQDKTGKPHLRAKYQHWRREGAWQNEDQFSDGTLRFIGLLWSLLDEGGPALLEEPELSLHPGVIRHIPGLLARSQAISRRQVLITTHSADLLQDEGIGLDEVLLLKPSQNGTEVTPATTIRDIKPLLDGGLSLADVVLPLTMPEDADQLSLAFMGQER